jgi:N-acetylglutamate synthase-like GNAT family acetyltransferase
MSEPGHPSWSIRKATSSDLDAVTDIQKRTNRPARSDSVVSEYFVAVSGLRIVGCAAVRKRAKIGYLYGLAVDKAWRRQGIGHALTCVRLNWLCTQRATSALVLAMFWNVKFFKKHGFILTNKSTFARLERLHRDFSDRWSTRSALLVLDLALFSQSHETTND